jgi:erythromycin esterase
MPDAPPIHALRDATVPLQTTDPAERGQGLDAIGDALASASVVGLGEATHGTRECFELKARVVRHLVEERGLRLLAIEAAFADTMAVDAYVRGERDGDPAAAVAEMGFWTWSTAAVRDLVAWLRAFNDGRDPGDRVRVFGVDVQDIGGSATALREYLEESVPADDALADDLRALEAGIDYRPDGAEDDGESAVERLESVAPAVATHLDDHRAACVTATGERAFRVARRHATVLGRAAEFWRLMVDGDDLVPLAATEARDEAMADNVAWLREHAGRDRVAVWAHSGHVKRGQTDWFDGDAAAMGEFLAREFGDDYYALGFDFHHGAFHARDSDADDMELREFAVDCGRDDALAQTLYATDRDLAFLDFDAAREAGLGDWLDRTHPVRSIGGGYSRDSAADYWEDYTLARAFDGLLFAAETTTTRLLDVEPVADARGN